jgi:VanZ family protein
MTFLTPRILLPLSFFIFISYIIFLADTADHNFAFRLVGHVPYGDKIAHAGLYGIMALLLNYGLGFRRVLLPQHLQLLHKIKGMFSFVLKGALANAPYMGSVIVLTFATLEELTQYYIPSRTFDLGDLLADFVGVILFSYWRIR